MLLWELAFQKIPYEEWDLQKISKHVLKRKREKIYLEKSGDNLKIQSDYFEIISLGKCLCL